MVLQLFKKKNNLDIHRKKTKTADTLIILSSLFLVLVLIFHQYLTLNQNFIFFTIPYLCSIIHIFYNKLFNKDYFIAVFKQEILVELKGKN